MTIYEENRQMLLAKTATCVEQGTFSDIHRPNATSYRRFAEFEDDGTGVDSLMLLDGLDTGWQVHVGQ